MDIYQERIKPLFKQSGMKSAALEREIGIPARTISRWDNGWSKSYDKYLPKIAEYFGVSTDYLMGISDEERPLPSGAYVPDLSNVAMFPLVGAIKAGYNGLAPTYSGELAPFPTDFLSDDPMNYFAFRVKGNSMYPKILDGDIVLCHRTCSVDSGKVAVLIYDEDEITVKKVNYVYGEDWLELIPYNPEYETKRIEGDDLAKCKVIGEVVKLMRNEL